MVAQFTLPLAISNSISKANSPTSIWLGIPKASDLEVIPFLLNVIKLLRFFYLTSREIVGIMLVQIMGIRSGGEDLSK